MREDSDERYAKIHELRRELAELSTSLGKLRVAHMNSGKAVLLRYIAHRITEVIEVLRELDPRPEPKSKAA
jgi:hypothetical protein